MDILPKIPKGLAEVLEKVKNPLAYLAFLVFLAAGLFATVLVAPIADNLKIFLVFVFLGLLVWAFVISVLYVTNSDGEREKRIYNATTKPQEIAEDVWEKSGQDAAEKLAGEISAGDSEEKQKEALAKAIEAIAEEAEKSPKLVDLALRALSDGKTDRAETLFEMILEEESEGDERRAEAALHLGSLRFLHDTQGALEAFLKVTELTPEDSDGWDRVGLLFKRLGQYEEAEYALRQMVIIGENTGDKSVIADAESRLGLVHNDRDDLKAAKRSHLRSLELYKSLGSYSGMAAAYGNLGVIYRKRGDLKKAEKMTNKALSINRKMKVEEGIAANLGNLGTIYAERGQSEKAEKTFREVLNINIDLGQIEEASMMYCNLGNIQILSGNLEGAAEMYEKSYELAEKLGLKIIMARASNNLSAINSQKAQSGEEMNLNDKVENGEKAEEMKIRISDHPSNDNASDEDSD